MSTYSVGADPELFLVNQEGKVVSAIGKIGGTKSHPIPVKSLGKGYAVQEDNVLAEYNIPPCGTAATFSRAHSNMLDWLGKQVGKQGLSIKVSASEIMPQEELMDPRAMVFGCDPDFNVWALEANPKPFSTNPLLRSAGGHVHVGVRANKADKVHIGRTLDAYLGLWSVLIDKDTRRRDLYGRAGSIRFKPYGLEYRTLSNFWVQEYPQKVFNLVHYALLHVRKGYKDVSLYGKDIQRAINDSDQSLAQNLIEEVCIND